MDYGVGEADLFRYRPASALSYLSLSHVFAQPLAHGRDGRKLCRVHGVGGNCVFSPLYRCLYVSNAARGSDDVETGVAAVGGVAVLVCSCAAAGNGARPFHYLHDVACHDAVYRGQKDDDRQARDGVSVGCFAVLYFGHSSVQRRQDDTVGLVCQRPARVQT